MSKPIAVKGRIVQLKDGSFVVLEDDEVFSPAREVLKTDAKGFAGPDSSGNYWCPPNKLHPKGAWFPHNNDPAYEHEGGTIYEPPAPGKERGDRPDLNAMGRYTWPR